MMVNSYSGEDQADNSRRRRYSDTNTVAVLTRSLVEGAGH